MKKILLLVVLVAGSFSAAAQLSVTEISALSGVEFTFFNASNQNALAVGDLITNRCVTVQEASGDNSAITVVGTKYIYKFDSPSGQLYRGISIGGADPASYSALGAPKTGAQLTFFTNNFSSGLWNRLYTKKAGGGYNAVTITD